MISNVGESNFHTISPQKQMEYMVVNPNATQTSGSCGTMQSELNITFSGGFIIFTFVKVIVAFRGKGVFRVGELELGLPSIQLVLCEKAFHPCRCYFPTWI